jgi:pimeloyl-ACP methyl ester carboxylesterase
MPLPCQNQPTQVGNQEHSRDIWVGYGNYDGIAPAHNSEQIASRIRGAELHGYEGGHGFLFQDPAALPAFIAFLKEPSS